MYIFFIYFGYILHIYIFIYLFIYVFDYILVIFYIYIYIYVFIYFLGHIFVIFYIYIYIYIFIYLYIYFWVYFGYILHIYIYIFSVIHRQTVSFYQNSSVWLDTQDARCRDQNPSNFTLDCDSDHSSTKRTTLAKGILKYFYF